MKVPFRSRTVDDIVGPLRSIVSKLENHEKQQHQIAIAKTEKAARLLAQSEDARNEAQYAASVRAKIGGLFS